MKFRKIVNCFFFGKWFAVPPVVGMVALNDFIILCLLDHLDLVDAPLAIPTGTGGGDGGEADVSVSCSLAGSTGVVKSLDGCTSSSLVMFMMSSGALLLAVEGEGVQKGSFPSSVLGLTAELTSGLATSDHQQNQKLNNKNV